MGNLNIKMFAVFMASCGKKQFNKKGVYLRVDPGPGPIVQNPGYFFP